VSAHGTATKYNRGKCRCAECVKAWSLYNAKRLRDFTPGDSLTPHGTVRRYRRYSCRCDECKAAVAAYERKRKAKRESA
jgi:hypothetical protein